MKQRQATLNIPIENVDDTIVRQDISTDNLGAVDVVVTVTDLNFELSTLNGGDLITILDVLRVEDLSGNNVETAAVTLASITSTHFSRFAYVRIFFSSSMEGSPVILSKASSLGAKIVTSLSESTVETRSAFLRASTSLSSLRAVAVVDTETGGKRTVSIVWATPLSKAISYWSACQLMRKNLSKSSQRECVAGIGHLQPS